jgi:hypothetical protein
MSLNFFFETILLLFAILISNGIIYSLTLFHLNTKNSSKNISVITNYTEKDVLAPTFLISSNIFWIKSLEASSSQNFSVTSSESSVSQSLSMTSSETNVSQSLSVTSSETNVSQDIFDSKDLIDLEINEGIMNQTQNTISSNTTEGTIPSNVDILDHMTSLDSITILNSQTLEQWRDIAMDLHELPTNTPPGILQQVKFEELNILYSQDIIHFGITQTELRLIIEHLPSISLFKPEINHLILTIMSYYHL